MPITSFRRSGVLRRPPLLSTLSRDGVTVIATIHQPSAAAFYTFDRLLLLHQGAPAGC